MTVILGTAGHIDHGKTALVRALTGIDTDRLKEERERGISIALGFAHFTCGGVEAGVVDVPGHERFLRTMLAGAHGIDVALLVVAADDGVMPQTREHLDVLHLLGVRHGVVAMSKIDLADAARRRAVRAEIERLLAGSSLEGAPIVEVSAPSGDGMAALRAALDDLIRDYRRPAADPGGFRLPIDRAFVLPGHGVVVTGTAIAGTVQAGAALRILPGGGTVRVRAVQVHGRPVDAAGRGQRVALNLSGAAVDAVRRGDILCDPALDRATDRCDAWVELRPSAARRLRRHAAVRVHAGTAEALGKIVWLDGRDALQPGEAAFAQLALRQPLALCAGDRFILRSENATATVGGGVVLHPFAERPRRGGDARLPHLAALRDAPTAAARLPALLALDPAVAVTAAALAAAANLPAERVVADLADAAPPLRRIGDDAYTTDAKWQRLCEAVRDRLAAFHRAQPDAPGLEMESLRSQLAAALPAKVFRAAVDQLAGEGVLLRAGSLLRLPQHRVELAFRDGRLAARAAAALAKAGFTPPDVARLAADLRLPPARLGAILSALEREGRVVRAAPELYFAAPAVERARALLRQHLAAHGAIDAAGFRDLLGASRKYSIALLDYLDRTGFTMRVGDVRKLRKP